MGDCGVHLHTQPGMPTGTLERAPGQNYPGCPVSYQLNVVFFKLVEGVI